MIKELRWPSEKSRTLYHYTYRIHANFSLFQLRLGTTAEEGGDTNLVEVQIECLHDPSLNRTFNIARLQLGRIQEVRA